MEIRDRLWTADAQAELYDGDAAAYQAAVLEQYKLYVEMADRVSQRRGLANTFFLTLNSGVFTLIGVVWEDRAEGAAWWLVFPLIALLGQCAAWSVLVRSYRTLNAAKYQVIEALEERLPASPYAKGEWVALNEVRTYRPLSQVENWIPALFAGIYLAGFVALLAA
jgi:hypothetical protein